jgi:hypothetical protein
MTLTFPDEIAQQIQGLSNPSEFVNLVVKDALKKLAIQQQKASESIVLLCGTTLAKK